MHDSIASVVVVAMTAGRAFADPPSVDGAWKILNVLRVKQVRPGDKR